VGIEATIIIQKQKKIERKKRNEEKPKKKLVEKPLISLL